MIILEFVLSQCGFPDLHDRPECEDIEADKTEKAYLGKGGTLEMCTPKPLWTPAHLKQMNVPLLIDAQLARDAAPPPWQSAQYLLCGKLSNCFKSSIFFLLTSIDTPFVSPAFLYNTNGRQPSPMLGCPLYVNEETYRTCFDSTAAQTGMEQV